MRWILTLVGLALVWGVAELFDGGIGGLYVSAAIGAVVVLLQVQKLQRLERQIDLLGAELKRLQATPQAVASAAAAVTASAPDADSIAATDTGTLSSSGPASARSAAAPSIGYTQDEAVPSLTAIEAFDAAGTPAQATVIDDDISAIAATPTTPARPATDERSLHITTSLGASILAWFKGGNTIVRVAVLILFIGVAFLLRYASEHTTVPIEWRLAGVALGGLGLVALGMRMVGQRRGYGLSLQGAGIGIVYLVLFASYRLYALVPSGLTFALLAMLALVTALLAVRQDALPLAALGFGGGFLAPVLVSTGQGSHVALFSYYLLLNLAIAWIANRQSWKLLNVLGFVFTFGIGAAWGAKAYTPEHFWSTEPFLIVNFLLYLYIAVQYTRRLIEQPEAGAMRLPVVDGTLLFGVPIVAFGLQAAMLKDTPFALALSSAAMSAIYLLVGRWLWRIAGRRVVLLIEGMLALGLIFLILVTPLALDARWTSAAWAVQGAGVVWIGLRQRRWWAAGMGLLMQIAAAFCYWLSPLRPADALPFANAAFLATLLLAAAASTSAWLLMRVARREAAGHVEGEAEVRPAWVARCFVPLHWLMLALALVQAWDGGWTELLHTGLSTLDDDMRAALLAAVFAIALELAHRPLHWPALRLPARGAMLLALLFSTGGVLERFGRVMPLWDRYLNGGLIEAIGLVAVGAWLGRRLDRDEGARVGAITDDAVAPATNINAETGAPTRRRNVRDGDLRGLEKLALAWFAMLQGGVIFYLLGAVHVARHLGWTPAAAILPPTLIALALIARASHQAWPVGRHASLHVSGLLRPWLAMLMLSVLAVNAFSDASMAPLPYLPLLNPLDLGHALVLLYALRLSRFAPWPAAMHKPVAIVAAALAFWWLNSLTIRTLHHWAGTPMWFDGALDSGLVQTSLTLLWTITALVTMLFATRRAPTAAARPLWMVGAALLGVVVLKLFVVDLSNVGALARIVSFLAVGGLMLVIGYVSPMPPAARVAKAIS